MATIILVGQDDIQLNRERAQEIKKDWNNGKFEKDSKIRIGQNSIKAGDIRSIRISKQDKEEANVTELSTEEIKNKLGDFEDRYKKHKSGELKTYEGLGVMDTGIHDWLEEAGVISGKGIGPELYTRFSDKRKLLEELNYRRGYAEKKDEEYREQIK